MGLAPQELNAWLMLHEMNFSHVQDLKNDTASIPLPFDNLFGDPRILRMAIPFQSPKVEEIEQWVINHGFYQYADNGMVAKEKNPDGTLRNPTRMGRALQNIERMADKDCMRRKYAVLDYRGEIFPDHIFKTLQSVVRGVASMRMQGRRVRKDGSPSKDIPFTQADIWLELASNAKHFGPPNTDYWMLGRGHIISNVIHNGYGGSNPKIPDWVIPEDLLKLTEEFMESLNIARGARSNMNAWQEIGGPMHLILSRAPIDVLRMSDFKHIQSCHSPEGSYWESALAEAREGGLIAYAVRDEQFNGLGYALSTGKCPALRLRLQELGDEYDSLVEWSQSNKLSDEELEAIEGIENQFLVWLGRKPTHQGSHNVDPDPEPFIRWGKSHGFFTEFEEDMERLPDRDELLQADEIFKDPDRKVPGIVPASRLRVRRYVKRDRDPLADDLAIPEMRAYGKDLDLYDAVRDWLRQMQQPESMSPEEAKTYGVVGGKYTDTDHAVLWSNYFDDASLKDISIRYIGDQDIDWENEDPDAYYDQMREETEEITELINASISPFSIETAAIYDGDGIDIVAHLWFKFYVPAHALADGVSPHGDIGDIELLDEDGEPLDHDILALQLGRALNANVGEIENEPMVSWLPENGRIAVFISCYSEYLAHPDELHAIYDDYETRSPKDLVLEVWELLAPSILKSHENYASTQREYPMAHIRGLASELHSSTLRRVPDAYFQDHLDEMGMAQKNAFEEWLYGWVSGRSGGDELLPDAEAMAFVEKMADGFFLRFDSEVHYAWQRFYRALKHAVSNNLSLTYSA